MYTLYARAPSPYYTRSLGVSDSVNLHIQVLICYFDDQMFGENHTPYEEPKFSYLIVLSQYFLAFLYSYCFHDSVHCTQYLLYIFIPMLSLCWKFIYHIGVILILHSDYIAYSGYFSLSVYV